MWNLTDLPDSSPLISEALEGQLVPLLNRITAPVTLVCLTDDGEKSREMLVFLRHICRLCPALSLQTAVSDDEPALAQWLDGTLLPATGFINAAGHCRTMFHGIPGGQELTGFVGALLSAAGCAKALDKPTLKDIAKIKAPAELMVCVSLSCRHCAQLVLHAQRIAAENPLITAHMVDANLYPALVERYQLQRVPVLLADGAVLAAGGMTLPELCTLLKKRK